MKKYSKHRKKKINPFEMNVFRSWKQYRKRRLNAEVQDLIWWEPMEVENEKI